MSNERYQVNLEADLGEQPSYSSVPEDEPFRIVLLGDFSGREGRARREQFGDLVSVQVDRDNIDDVIGGLRPEVHLQGVEPHSAFRAIRISSLDDFHPDQLYQRWPVFEGLGQLRRRLLTPAHRPASRVAQPGPTRLALSDSLLDQIVGGTQDQLPKGTGDLADFIDSVVAAHVVDEPDASQQSKLALLDQVTTDAMRRVLHDPVFQATEGLWRAVALLASRIEGGIELHLVDITKAELRVCTQDETDVSQTVLSRLLTAPRVRWGLLVGAYSFEPEPGDISLLARLASIARVSGAPWVSSAGASFMTVISDGGGSPTGGQLTEWNAFRHTPEAEWVALGVPRFLLRLPYGSGGALCEMLPFEELPEAPNPSHFLWANPAFAAGLALVEAFQSVGWMLCPEATVEIQGIPLYVRGKGVDATVAPGTETVLGEAGAERSHDQGLTPLLWMRDSDKFRVGWRSTADPPKALRGAWGTCRPGPTES